MCTKRCNTIFKIWVKYKIKMIKVNFNWFQLHEIWPRISFCNLYFEAFYVHLYVITVEISPIPPFQII